MRMKALNDLGSVLPGQTSVAEQLRGTNVEPFNLEFHSRLLDRHPGSIEMMEMDALVPDIPNINAGVTLRNLREGPRPFSTPKDAFNLQKFIPEKVEDSMLNYLTDKDIEMTEMFNRRDRGYSWESGMDEELDGKQAEVPEDTPDAFKEEDEFLERERGMSWEDAGEPGDIELQEINIDGLEAPPVPKAGRIDPSVEPIQPELDALEVGVAEDIRPWYARVLRNVTPSAILQTSEFQLQAARQAVQVARNGLTAAEYTPIYLESLERASVGIVEGGIAWFKALTWAEIGEGIFTAAWSLGVGFLNCFIR